MNNKEKDELVKGLNKNWKEPQEYAVDGILSHIGKGAMWSTLYDGMASLMLRTLSIRLILSLNLFLLAIGSRHGKLSMKKIDKTAGTIKDVKNERIE